MSFYYSAGKPKEADRLKRPGRKGYPDEPDVPYLAIQVSVGFEIVQEGSPYKPHYGNVPIRAVLR